MKRPIKKLLFIPLIIAGIALFSLITMVLWNALMPEIFGLPMITFFQALGLLVLSKLLLGRFGPQGGKGKFKRKCGPFKDKWDSMTPEEREEFFRSRRPDWSPRGKEDTGKV